MAFTAMVMTADKEEVVDFIAPYFEQSGISIGNAQHLNSLVEKIVTQLTLFQ